jgi:hypothetical protein
MFLAVEMERKKNALPLGSCLPRGKKRNEILPLSQGSSTVCLL